MNVFSSISVWLRLQADRNYFKRSPVDLSLMEVLQICTERGSHCGKLMNEYMHGVNGHNSITRPHSDLVNTEDTNEFGSSSVTYLAAVQVD